MEKLELSDQKRCSGPCRGVKPLSEFYRRRNRPNGFQSYCKECSNKNRWKNGRFRDNDNRLKVNAQNRASYARNKDRILSAQQERRQNEKQKYAQRKIAALELCGQKDCQACGFDHPGALQFHHRNPSEKNFAISTKLYEITVDWGAIEQELRKCEVLCSNCHDLEHHYQSWLWWEEIEINKAKERGEDYLGEKESTKSRKEK